MCLSLIAGLCQVKKDVFVSDVLPLIESQLSCGWQTCDQNTLLLVMVANKCKLVSISDHISRFLPAR